MKTLLSLTALTALLTLSPTAFAGYKEIEVTDGGTITGKVAFAGTAPPKTTITQDTGTCGTGGDDARVTVNEGMLQNALVFLRKVKKGKAWPAEMKSVVSDQTSCVFLPHVAVVGEGGVVEFKNSDNVLHNVKSSSVKNTAFNEGVEGNGSIKKTFTKGHEVVKVTCSVHSWMVSYVVVAAHPYYAVTAADGTFTISGVPAGKYEVIIWHGEAKTTTVGIDGGKEGKQGKKGTKFKMAAGGTITVSATVK
jgi:plastocyanin